MTTTKAEFGCLSTAIGSMPHADPVAACALVRKHLQLPHWPQLPKRSLLENMYVQYSEGFPGATVNGDKISVSREAHFDEQLEKLYYADAEDKFNDYATGTDYAAGLHTFVSSSSGQASLVKGQITGPISQGLCALDESGRGILYDDMLAETLAKFLRLKAMWQERYLRTISANTVIFFDEPYLTSLGSAFVAIPNEQVTSLLETVFSGIEGFKGVHCCGSTDWSLLLASSADVISFDAYNYADSLSTYVSEVIAYLKRGSAIAWGIVPNDEETLAKESVASLADRLGEAMAPFTKDTISYKQLIAQSLITPSCGLPSLSFEAAELALSLTADLAARLRSKYVS
ncbi:MAG TPA: methionine synthase [Dehalococcoidia bacterium]|nr:methionine synthase [Dehalococcoidia bacterium]